MAVKVQSGELKAILLPWTPLPRPQGLLGDQFVMGWMKPIVAWEKRAENIVSGFSIALASCPAAGGPPGKGNQRSLPA